MRLPSVVRAVALFPIALALVSSPLVAQTNLQPASVPEDLWDFGCVRWDEYACDQVPQENLNDPPVVGTWVRISLLRNSFSVQPPDAPLYLIVMPDGYWSMFEFPANRPRYNLPMGEQTSAQLFRRFDKLEGSFGWWTWDGTVLNRHHMGGVNPGADGESDQRREVIWENSIMAMLGTGSNRSPQARMRKLPVQPLSTRALVGTWDRTTHTVNGQAVTGATVPQRIFLNDDGWFHQIVMPRGRTNPGKPRAEYTPADYVTAFAGLALARGTYDIVDGNTLVRFHAANLDPNLTGWREVAQYTLAGNTMTLQGVDESGARYQSTYTRQAPRSTRP